MDEDDGDESVGRSGLKSMFLFRSYSRGPVSWSCRRILRDVQNDVCAWDKQQTHQQFKRHRKKKKSCRKVHLPSLTHCCRVLANDEKGVALGGEKGRTRGGK